MRKKKMNFLGFLSMSFSWKGERRRTGAPASGGPPDAGARMLQLYDIQYGLADAQHAPGAEAQGQLSPLPAAGEQQGAVL